MMSNKADTSKDNSLESSNSNAALAIKSSETSYIDPPICVILEAACLELTEGKNKTLELLNNLDHRSSLRKLQRLPEDIRPDITHQCLMSLLDSPLNKAGKLKVYIRTADNQLIEISPQLLVPRTWKQFSNMMVTFLQTRKIKANEKNIPLMKLVKNDIPQIIPPGGKKIGLSVNGRHIDLEKLIENDRKSFVGPTYFIGAVAHSDPTFQCPFVEDLICISSFPLTASVCCNKICASYEHLYDIF